MIEKVKAALSAAGCIDVDAAIVIGDLGKLADAGAVEAAVGALKESKAYMFGAASTSADHGARNGVVIGDSRIGGAVTGMAEASALNMTDKEYEAAKWKMRNDAEQRRRASIEPVHYSGKSALEMTDEEYAAARRRSAAHPTYSMSGAPDALARLAENRGTGGHDAAPTAGAIMMRDRKPGEHRRQPAPVWLGRPTMVVIGPR